MDARQRSMWPVVQKELWMLGPLWFVAVAGLLCTWGLFDSPRAAGIAGPFYAITVIALGAVSFGQEFRHRTLASLLVQPVSRLETLVIKLAVLAVVTAAPVWFVWTESQTVLHPLYAVSRGVVVVPAACALLLAPWFTLLARSELAGMAFAAAVPAVLLLAGQTAALLTYGATRPSDAPEVVRLTWQVFTTGLVVACMAGAVGVVRTFLRLEAVEGRPGGAGAPRWLGTRSGNSTRASLRRSNAYRLLALKELRLQALPAGVAGLFVLAWTAVWLARESLGSKMDLDALRGVMSAMYVVLTVALVSAAASAGEKELDTVSAQTLLPRAAWQQWLVKVAVVALVVIALTFGLLGVLTSAMPGPAFIFRTEIWWVLAVAVTAGLYVSSVNRGTLRALVMMIGVAIVLTIGIQLADRPLMRTSQWTARTLVTTGEMGWSISARTGRLVREWMPIGAGGLMVVVLTGLAMRNHHSLERGTATVRRQAPWIATGLIALLLLLAVADGVLNAGAYWAYWRSQSGAAAAPGR